jgi:hypothetical protein
MSVAPKLFVGSSQMFSWWLREPNSEQPVKLTPLQPHRSSYLANINAHCDFGDRRLKRVDNVLEKKSKIAVYDLQYPCQRQLNT